MRILILHSRYLSGDTSGENRVVRDETALLAAAGHDVTAWDPSPVTASGLGLVRTGVDAIWSRSSAARIDRLIEHARPEIVHCHNLFPMLSPAAIRTAHRSGAAVLMTLHNYRLMCLPSTFLRDGRICQDCAGRAPLPGVRHRCYRGSLAGSATLAGSLMLHRQIGTWDRVTRYLAVSDFVRRMHVESGLSPDRIRVKSNFVPGVPRRVGPGEHFLFLGRLSPEKGVDTLIRAWSHLDAHLVIVGDGPEAETLKRGAPATVGFVGAVPGDEVADLVARARAVLVPSIWFEAQPRVILEAYAAGVPVVVSALGGLPDLVEDGRTGHVVPPGRPEAWAGAIHALTNDETSVRMGDAAFATWTERYSPDRGLASLEEAYAEAIDARAAEPG